MATPLSPKLSCNRLKPSMLPCSTYVLHQFQPSENCVSCMSVKLNTYGARKLPTMASVSKVMTEAQPAVSSSPASWSYSLKVNTSPSSP